MTVTEEIELKIEEIKNHLEDAKTVIKTKGIEFESAQLEDLPGLIGQIISKNEISNADQYSYGASDYSEIVDEEGNTLSYDDNNALIV